MKGDQQVTQGIRLKGAPDNIACSNFGVGLRYVFTLP